MQSSVLMPKVAVDRMAYLFRNSGDPDAYTSSELRDYGNVAVVYGACRYGKVSLSIVNRKRILVYSGLSIMRKRYTLTKPEGPVDMADIFGALRIAEERLKDLKRKFDNY